MKILLTGSGGFIGRYVLSKIKEKGNEYEITVLSDSRVHDGSVRYLSTLNYGFNDKYLIDNGCNADVLIHMGAFTPKSSDEGNNIGASTSNIFNTNSLLNAVKECTNIKKIIFISTLDVYEETDEEISEVTKTIPQTMYGCSKLYCEQMIKNFAYQNNINFEILRLGHVYGPGEEKYRKVMPVMIQNAMAGKDITIFGDGEALRTFIYVEDVAEAIVKSISYEKSDIINVVGSNSISIKNLAQLIINKVDSNVKINYIRSCFRNRNIRFNNNKLMTSLLCSLTPLEKGIEKEIEYMQSKM